MATGYQSISLNFLVAGHTKFAPDWCCGLVKHEMASVVNGSAVVNMAQLVVTEDGKTVVPVSDWQTHLSEFFKPLPGIKKYHHFRYIF